MQPGQNHWMAQDPGLAHSFLPEQGCWAEHESLWGLCFWGPWLGWYLGPCHPLVSFLKTPADSWAVVVVGILTRTTAPHCSLCSGWASSLSLRGESWEQIRGHLTGNDAYLGQAHLLGPRSPEDP